MIIGIRPKNINCCVPVIREKKIWLGGIYFILFFYSMTVTQYLMTVIQFMASLGPQMADKALKLPQLKFRQVI